MGVYYHRANSGKCIVTSYIDVNYKPIYKELKDRIVEQQCAYAKSIEASYYWADEEDLSGYIDFRPPFKFIEMWWCKFAGLSKVFETHERAFYFDPDVVIKTTEDIFNFNTDNLCARINGEISQSVRYMCEFWNDKKVPQGINIHGGVFGMSRELFHRLDIKDSLKKQKLLTDLYGIYKDREDVWSLVKLDDEQVILYPVHRDGLPITDIGNLWNWDVRDEGDLSNSQAKLCHYGNKKLFKEYWGV